MNSALLHESSILFWDLPALRRMQVSQPPLRCKRRVSRSAAEAVRNAHESHIRGTGAVASWHSAHVHHPSTRFSSCGSSFRLGYGVHLNVAYSNMVIHGHVPRMKPRGKDSNTIWMYSAHAER